MVHMELVKGDLIYGYVVLHGDLANMATNPDGVEVIVGSDGAPFHTSVEAAVCAKVTCSESFQIVAVRNAERSARSSVVRRSA